MRKSRFLIALGLLLAMAGGAWWQRDALLTTYYLFRLNQADEVDREDWVDRLLELDEAAQPTLIGRLGRDDADGCRRAAEVLGRLAQAWGMDDPRWDRLTVRLSERFSRFSASGQAAALELVRDWVLKAPVGQAAALQTLAARLVPIGGRSSQAATRAAALNLTDTLMQKGGLAGGFSVYRDLIRSALEDAAPANRLQAIRLAGHREMNLLPRIAPLLDDPAPEVRQAAMLAIGGNPEAVATDDLLRSLHDADPEVRRLCEAALKSRGLRGEDLALARLVTDARPATRLQVLHALQRTSDLDPEVWLRRLSHDPAPAVRAAVLRAAVDRYDVDLRDRLEQIAASDPSPTVRQIAEHYRGRKSAERGARER